MYLRVPEMTRAFKFPPHLFHYLIMHSLYLQSVQKIHLSTLLLGLTSLLGKPIINLQRNLNMTKTANEKE